MAINVQPDFSVKSDTTIVNDFAFTVSTKNGSGSQTSNTILVKSLFNMGIPVNGKNLFPSNIKGLPTWYTIRVSKDGYTARRATTEIVVTYNETTAAEDIANLPSGGVCIIPRDWNWEHSRDDIIYYEIPIKELMKQVEIPSRFAKQVENMTYVGAIARLFGIEPDMIYRVLLENFNGKEGPAKMNMQVVQLAYDWTAENIHKRDPFRFEPMSLTEGKIFITGNQAGALGALFGGLHLAAWYPITPASSLADALLSFRNLREAPDGRQTLAVVQAEDELAAIGMAVGAGWAGARALTSTSGPGISLMAEFAGLAYFAEIPIVVWDIQRMGPSTGLPTRTSQADLLFAHFLGHGDTRQLCLLPGSPEECFEFGWKAFDFADEFQTPVFVLSDLDLGMNNWMADPFEYPDQPINRGKTLDEETLQAFIKKYGKWGRYMDVDGDGIAYRTIPGTNHPMAAYFTRGTGHNEMAVYSERSDDWVANMDRLSRKIETARSRLPEPILNASPDAKIGIISWGSNHPAIMEAQDKLAAQGIETDYMRIRALPLAEAVTEFLHSHERVFVIENNYDGQMYQIICMEHPEDVSHLVSLSLGDGLPMTSKWIIDNILEKEGR